MFGFSGEVGLYACFVSFSNGFPLYFVWRSTCWFLDAAICANDDETSTPSDAHKRRSSFRSAVTQQ